MSMELKPSSETIKYYRYYIFILNFRVPAFEATQYLITNKEFLDFVNDGGYSTKKYWTDEGMIIKGHCCIPCIYKM